jgi:4-hydroxy-2-oxoheptanedioate aldolase
MEEDLNFDNPVKVKLARGEAVWGASAMVADPFACQLTIDTGIDWLWIDTEHAPISPDGVGLAPVLARQRGCSPLIRVAGLDPSLIKKSLDAGASTIMVPQVNNAAEARAVVSYCKYAPEGTRGVSPGWTFYAGVNWSDYLPQANRETCVVVQIESVEGMNNVEEIAAVPGVDVVFAGPMDLSAAMGVIGQPQHEKVQTFLADFPKRVTTQGKYAGVTTGGGADAQERFRQGYRFMSMGGLLFSGQAGLIRDLKVLRESCKP